MTRATGDKYELEYQESKNIFFIKVWGFYLPEDAMAFIKDYNEITRKFIPENTSLVIDGTGLKTSKPEAKVLLVECMKLYKQLAYKNRIFIRSASPTANLMIRSAFKDGGMVEGKDCILLENNIQAEEYIRNI